jgi:hypothetical protein
MNWLRKIFGGSQLCSAMRAMTISLISLLMLVPIFTAQAAEKPMQDGKTLSQRLEQLRAGDFQVQEQTVEALAKLGQAAVPRLLGGD